MPKVNFSQSSIEVDPNRSLTEVGGNDTGEENLFSLLMNSITGDETQEPSAVDLLTSLEGKNINPEAVSLISKNSFGGGFDSEQLLEIEKELGIDLKNIDLSKLDIETISKDDLEVLSKLKNALSESKEPSNSLKLSDDSSIDKTIFSKRALSKLKNHNGLSELRKNNLELDIKNQLMSGQTMGVKNTNAYKALNGLNDSSLIKPVEDVIHQGDFANIKNLDSTTPQMNNGQFSSKIENNLFNKVSTNTIDLSQIDLGSSSGSEVINEIANHLDKMKLSSAKELSVVVKHNEFGQFQINANELKNGADPKLGLEILANSKDVQNFFKSNEVSLTSLLADKGFSVGSFRVGNSNSDASSKDFDMSNSEKEFSSQQQNSRGESRHQDSQRRANLWQQYQEQMGA